MHAHWFSGLVDIVFGAGLLINAMLFVPQAIRLFKKKESGELSLITFVGFCLTQLSAVIYGCLHGDYILMSGYLLAFATCSTVTVMIFLYREK